MGEVIDLTDVTQICRICLKRNDLLLSLDVKIEFERQEFSPISVIEALVSLTSVPIDIQNNLPSHICWDCKQLIKHALLLKYKFEKSISILKIFTSGILTNKNCPSERKLPKIQLQRVPREQQQQFPEVLQQLSKVQQSQYSQIQLDKQVYIEKPSDDDDPQKTTEQNYDHSDSQAYDSPVEANDEQDQEKNQSVKTQIQNTIQRKSTIHQCPICMLELSALQLRDHVQNHQALKKYLSIPKVSPTARFYTKPKKLLLPVQENRLHKCPICNQDIAAEDFYHHIQRHYKFDSDFSCDKCDRTFSKLNYLNIHRNQHLKEYPYQCEECNKGFVLKKNYDYHVLLHKDILSYACEFCPKRFSNPEHLNRHRTVHTENRSYSVKYKAKRCLKCLKTFKGKVLLREHECLPVSSKAPCKYCHKVFNSTRSLLRHLKCKHMRNHALCQVCGVKSKNIAAHMRVHRNDTKQRDSKSLCPVCGIYVSSINNHMARHSNIRAHKCPQCSKGFFTSQLLKKHQLIHTGLKPYACSVCSKSFNSQYNLKVHERIHLGIKRHICNVCNKGFLEKAYLKKHMTVHVKLDEKKSEPATTDLLMMDIQDEYASKFEFYEM